MAEPRDFHICDILSVTHEVMISTRSMVGVQDVLSFVTGVDLEMFQLMRAAEAVSPGIVAQLPKSVRDAFPNPGAMYTFIKKLEAEYGDRTLEEAVRILEDEHGQMISIRPVPGYEPDCPVEEAIDVFGPDKVYFYKAKPVQDDQGQVILRPDLSEDPISAKELSSHALSAMKRILKTPH
jgi:hypothetical protein